MPYSQLNDITSNSQERQEWLHITINKSPSAPPHIKEQSQNALHIAHNTSRTSPGYKGPKEAAPRHESMLWVACHNNRCLLNMSKEQGSGWYPQPTRRSRQPSVAPDQDWQPHMEEKPGEDSAPNNPERKISEGVREILSVGNTASMTTEETTDGKMWMLGTIPER